MIETINTGPGEPTIAEAAQLQHDSMWSTTNRHLRRTTIAARLEALIGDGHVVVVLAREPAGGTAVAVAVMRVLPSLWSNTEQAYLAEPYVTPTRRGRGYGREWLPAPHAMIPCVVSLRPRSCGGAMPDEVVNSQESLRPLIDSLEDEIVGLRQSARLRAVIEQAKGVLAERHGISLSEAFDRLRTISQQQNARLVDVAATVLGLTQTGQDGHLPAALDADLPGQLQASGAMSASWRSLRDRDGVRASAVGVVVESLAAATEDGDVAAELLVDLAGLTQPDGVLIYALRDNYLDLMGSARFPSEVTNEWSRVSLSLDIPLTGPLRRGQPEFVDSSEALLAAYPTLTDVALYGYHSWLFAPVLDHAQAKGLVVMGWESARDIDEVERQRLLALVNRTGPVFLRTLTGREPAKQQLTGLLRLSRDPWMVLVPASPAERAVESLIVEAAAPEIPGSQQWVGRRLLAAIPGLADHRALTTDLTRLLRDDALFVLAIDIAGTSGAPWDSGPGQLRAVRTGRRLVLTWHDEPV